MPTPRKYSQPYSHYVNVYSKSLATIKRWSKAGAPMDNAKAMSAWIAEQGKSKVKGMPVAKGITKKPKAAKASAPVEEASPSLFTPPSKVDPVDTKKVGAAQALKRLQIEEMEQKAALDHGKRRMEAIREEVEKLMDKLAVMPDPESSDYKALSAKAVERQNLLNEAEATYATWSKTALELWLKTCESLLRYEKTVDESKRASGEVVPRVEAEQAMIMAAHWLRVSIVRYIKGNVDDLLEQSSATVMQGIILDGVSESLEAQLRNSKKVATPLKDWQIEAIKRGFSAS